MAHAYYSRTTSKVLPTLLHRQVSCDLARYRKMSSALSWIVLWLLLLLVFILLNVLIQNSWRQNLHWLLMLLNLWQLSIPPLVWLSSEKEISAPVIPWSNWVLQNSFWPWFFSGYPRWEWSMYLDWHWSNLHYLGIQSQSQLYHLANGQQLGYFWQQT